MAYDTALSLLKIDLGISHTARDDLFTSKLQAADAELGGRGIVLDMSLTDDVVLLVDYTAWLYRNRDTEKAMPLHLVLRLNNRKVKGRAADDET
jgi:hypothetical protein